ncbi:MAG: CDP-diacylglycerol--serine O-phosphatidyltransferase [Clostridia bacterium]|nr:CDP-diacylglycerol--serine O-phosphatidyltransferase [Clostridia bacterium]
MVSFPIKERIPSIITLLNLLAGMLSLFYSLQDDFILAAVMILIGVLLDGLDGKAARKLKATSEFGKQLDSLCDLVSFGVAPAMLVYSWKMEQILLLGAAAGIIFVICGALRLARFNVLNISDYFVGMPITAAGCFSALLVLVGEALHPLLVVVIMLAFAFLMICRWKFPKI